MKRSVISWYTALSHLEDKPAPLVKKLRRKIEDATNHQPMSAMIDIPVAAAEVELIERAIERSVHQATATRRAQSTTGEE